jgi:queuine tRNA-ribosyltransferase
LVLFLASLHNIHFYMELVKKAREAILQNQFDIWKKDFYNRYKL